MSYTSGILPGLTDLIMSVLEFNTGATLIKVLDLKYLERKKSFSFKSDHFVETIR